MRTATGLVKWGLLAMLPAVWIATAAADQNCGKKASTAGGMVSASTPHKDSRPGNKDAIAAAYVIPGGVVLNAKQQGALNKLKSETAAPLRAAMVQAQSKNKEQSAKALAQSRDLHVKIRNRIKEIVAMGVVDAQRAAAAQLNADYRAHIIHREGDYGRCPCGR